MNKKSGFTLIELLAVIALIAIVATITGVIIVGNLSDTKDNLSAVQEKNIISVTKAYINDNLDDFTTTEPPSTSSLLCTDTGTTRTCTMSSDVLVSEGYIEQPKDLKNKNNAEYDINISFTFNDGFMSDIKISLNDITTISENKGTVVADNNDLTPIDASNIKSHAIEIPFSVTNTKDFHQKLTIKMTDIVMSDDLRNNIDFRWGLYNSDTGNGLSFGTFADIGSATEMVIYKDTIIDAANPDITKKYVLRIWVHDNGTGVDISKSFSAKVSVVGEKVEYTPEECFTFNSSTGAIYGTWDGNDTDEDGDGKPDSMTLGYDYTNSNCPSDVVIPREIGGVPITQIGDWTFGGFEVNSYGINLTSIIIPEGVTNIGNAFAGNNFTHLTIPENTIGTTKLDWGALMGLPLSSLYIPETVITLGGGLGISDQTTFTSLFVPGNVNLGTESLEFSSNYIKNIILMNGITTIGDGYGITIYGTNINTLEIPSTVTKVKTRALLYSNIDTIIVRGKTSLEEFTDATGLSELTGVNIIFR